MQKIRLDVLKIPKKIDNRYIKSVIMLGGEVNSDLVKKYFRSITSCKNPNVDFLELSNLLSRVKSITRKAKIIKKVLSGAKEFFSESSKFENDLGTRVADLIERLDLSKSVSLEK